MEARADLKQRALSFTQGFDQEEGTPTKDPAYFWKVSVDEALGSVNILTLQE